MSDGMRRLHLVRHGEVHNPEHLVYAGLEGFGLSDLGRAQAASASSWLARLDVRRVVSSPLERATETAAAIAEPHALSVTVDDDLVEWALMSRWAGHRWPALPEAFPGELEAYLSDPTDLPFAPETLEALSIRVAAAAERAWTAGSTGGDIVVVSHQDPIEVARRRLTGRDLGDFHAAKPAHAGVITLTGSCGDWREVVVFTPAQE